MLKCWQHSQIAESPLVVLVRGEISAMKKKKKKKRHKSQYPTMQLDTDMDPDTIQPHTHV